MTVGVIVLSHTQIAHLGWDYNCAAFVPITHDKCRQTDLLSRLCGACSSLPQLMLLLIAKKFVKIKFSINDSKATKEKENTNKNNKIATKLK